MKKIGYLFASVVMIMLFALTAGAASESELTFYLNSDGESYYVYECKASAQGELTIPATFNGKVVTSIGDRAFYNCTGLTSVTIPDSVTSIGVDAFYNTEYYNNLSNWTNRVLYIGNHLIEAFDSITSHNIRQGTKTIANSAFNGCTSLTSITIPNSVTAIGSYALNDCTKLKSVTIPKSVITIGDGAFRGCASLTSVTIPDGVTAIGDDTFEYCTNLASVIIGKGVKSIGNGAFYYCTSLANITIPDSVTSIGGMAFYDCDSLTSIIIPNSVTSIKNETFYSCAELTSIAIPASLKNIDANAFESTNLSYVFYGGTENQKNNMSIAFDGNERLIFDAAWHYNATGHSYGLYKTTKNATCTSAGSKQRTCSVCKYADKVTIAKTAHNYKTTTIKASLSKNGSVVTSCSTCGTKKSSTVISYPKTIKLSATTYTYNGKTKTPTVTVKDSKGKTLKNGTDYTVTYPKKRKSIGKYTVTVAFKGNYSGTKKLTFEIVPAKVTLSKLTAGSKQLTATWKTVSGVTGYEVVYSTSKKFTKKTTKKVTVKKAKTKKTTIKKLKKGKKYYVKVRAYKTVGKAKIYGAYSKVKSVKVK